MSKNVSLKDFYTNPDLEDEEEDSEEDSDFVPDENESDADDDKDLEEDVGEEEIGEKTESSSSGNDKKRCLPEEEEDRHSKKSRIDAIWADMNNKEESKKEVETKATDTATIAAASTSASITEETEITVAKKKKSPLTKRPKSSLSSLVSQYNIKEPKLNTLEKSKLDWQGYVDREGIREDLKYKNKDGYMEKVAFLQRVDDRRLSQLKTGQKKDANGKK